MNSAFGMSRRKRRPTINITSLIDVIFLLLIFFMVSSTFREHVGIDVALPEAETTDVQEMATHEIVVTETGDFYFGQQKVDETSLRDAIASLLEAEPEASLVLRADENADFGKALRAIDIARSVGGTRLIIPTRELGENRRAGR